MTKSCKWCGRTLPLTEEFFHRHAQMKDGFLNRCKDCVSAYRAEHYAKNSDTIRARVRAYQQENSDVISAKNKAAYAASPEKYSERNRRGYGRNRDLIKSRSREWRIANPDRVRTYRDAHRRRASEAPGSHTSVDIAAQLARQRGRCYWCGKRVGGTYHVDHVVPLSKGGSDGPENLVISCPTCNLRKNAKMPQDFPLPTGQTTLC